MKLSKNIRRKIASYNKENVDGKSEGGISTPRFVSQIQLREEPRQLIWVSACFERLEEFTDLCEVRFSSDYVGVIVIRPVDLIE